MQQAQLADIVVNEQFNCRIGSYQLTTVLQAGRIAFEIECETTYTSFEGFLSDDTLPSNIQKDYGNCRFLYSVLKESAASKGITFNESGVLKFEYTMKMNSLEIKKDVVVKLEEVHAPEEIMELQDIVQLLRKQCNRLEREVKTIRQAFRNENLALMKELNSVKEDFSKYKQLSGQSTQPKELPIASQFKFPNIKPMATQIDPSSKFYKQIVIRERSISLASPQHLEKGSNPKYSPFFLSKTPLKGLSCFQVDVVVAGNNSFLLGVAADYNRNHTETYHDKGTIYYHSAGNMSRWVCGISDNEITYQASSGDRIEVQINVDSETVVWMRVVPKAEVIGMAKFRGKMRDMDLYPCLELGSNFNGILKLVE